MSCEEFLPFSHDIAWFRGEYADKRPTDALDEARVELTKPNPRATLRVHCADQTLHLDAVFVSRACGTVRRALEAAGKAEIRVPNEIADGIEQALSWLYVEVKHPALLRSRPAGPLLAAADYLDLESLRQQCTECLEWRFGRFSSCITTHDHTRPRGSSCATVMRPEDLDILVYFVDTASRFRLEPLWEAIGAAFDHDGNNLFKGFVTWRQLCAAMGERLSASERLRLVEGSIHIMTRASDRLMGG